MMISVLFSSQTKSDASIWIDFMNCYKAGESSNKLDRKIRINVKIKFIVFHFELCSYNPDQVRVEVDIVCKEILILALPVLEMSQCVCVGVSVCVLAILTDFGMDS